MAKVLLTGGSGFIGSHFVRHPHGFQVQAADFDILNFELLMKALEAFQPDCILHLAGLSLPAQCDQHPSQAYQVNVAGTGLILEAMLKTKSSARLVFASTAQVYQPLQKGSEKKITEAHAIEPINLYARTKWMAENLVREYSQKYSLKATVLRIFNHVHCSQKAGTFLSSIYQEITQKKGQPHLTIPVGNMDLYRDMGSVGDLLGAISSLISKSNSLKNFETVNVCNGHERKLSTLAQLLADQMGVSVQFETDPSRFRDQDPKTVVGSHDHLTALTGWKPKVQSDLELIQAFLSSEF